MGNRGKERQVNCEKCGRTVRKDKAVYIEKPILQNPLERHQLAEPSTYRAVLTREVAYCPGCGKHLRVYEKKIKQNIRNDERAARQREFGDRGRGGFGGPSDFHHGPRREHPPRYGSTPSDSTAQGAAQDNSQTDGQTPAQEDASSNAASTENKVEESKESKESEESEESEVPAENEQSGQSQQGGQ